MHKAKWKSVVRHRLKECRIVRKEDGNYLKDPYKWDNAIRFEVRAYGSNFTHRSYLMRRWQTKILNLPKEFDWNRLNLLQILSDELVRKSTPKFKDPKIQDIKVNHYHSLAGYWAKRPTRKLLRYYSF